MTRQAISWIDSNDAKRLVDGLRAPVGTRAMPRVPVPAPRIALPEKQPTKAAAQLESIKLPARPTRDLSELHHSSSSILTRVEALCDWIDREVSPVSVYLADEHGLLVHGLRARVEYVAVMAPLLGAMRQLNAALGTEASRGSVTVREGEILHWAETTNSLGRFSLGILSNTLINDARLSRMQRELSRALEEQTT